MNNPLLKKLLPHVIALVLFVAVSMIFCWPAMEGNVLNQQKSVQLFFYGNVPSHLSYKLN